MDLLHAPEMRLLHPEERQSTTLTNVYDEGIGCGLDNGSPDAYAEHRVEVDAGAAEVAGLVHWTVPCPRLERGRHRYRPAAWRTCGFGGTLTSALGVLLQRLGDWAAHPERVVNWDAGVNSMRVHLAVDGTFPDGSTGSRAG